MAEPVYEARIWETAGRYRWSLMFHDELVAGATKSLKTRAEALEQAKMAKRRHQDDTPVEFVNLDEED